MRFAHRGACRGQLFELTTAHPFAHKLHSLPLFLISKPLRIEDTRFAQRERPLAQGADLCERQHRHYFVKRANLWNTLQAAPARDAPTLRQSQTVLRTV